MLKLKKKFRRLRVKKLFYARVTCVVDFVTLCSDRRYDCYVSLFLVGNPVSYFDNLEATVGSEADYSR